MRRVTRLLIWVWTISFVAMPVFAQLQDFRPRDSWPETTVGIGSPESDADEDSDEGSDLPCYVEDDVRFADCGNGTVTDQVTGRVWLENSTCLGIRYYAEANAVAASLGEGTHPECGLTDGSSPGDWRLPSREEWEELIAQGIVNGCSGVDVFIVPDREGLGCWTANDPFSDPPLVFPLYWSATTVVDRPSNAWGITVVSFGGPAFSKWHKRFIDEPDGDASPPLRIWPVRGRTD